MNEKENKMDKRTIIIASILTAVVVLVFVYFSLPDDEPTPEPTGPGVTSAPTVPGTPDPTETASPTPSPTASETVEVEDVNTIDDRLPPAPEHDVSAEDSMAAEEVFWDYLADYMAINKETLSERNERLAGKIATDSPLWLEHPSFGDLNDSEYSPDNQLIGYAELSHRESFGGTTEDYRSFFSFTYTYLVDDLGTEAEEILDSEGLVAQETVQLVVTMKKEDGKWVLNDLESAAG